MGDENEDDDDDDEDMMIVAQLHNKERERMTTDAVDDDYSLRDLERFVSVTASQVVSLSVSRISNRLPRLNKKSRYGTVSVTS